MAKSPALLQLADFPVTQVRLGKQTRYSGGTLEINAEEVRAIALADKRIEAAKVELVLPGEKTRIFGIRDVVEPRVKVSGPGQVFPGVLGPVEPVGEGVDHRLTGVRLMAVADYEGTIRSGVQVERSAVLDMWGPGAEVSEYSRDIAVVLVLALSPGLPEWEAHTVVQQAEYKVGRRLAEATVGLEPARVETFGLAGDVPASLPRVVFIQSVITNPDAPHTGVGYYGMPIRESLNTLVYPNEILDGILTPNCIRQVGHRPNTYDWMNHPIVLGLHREHGQTMNFLGVILQRIQFEAAVGKEITAQNAAGMAEILGADHALISWMGGGNAFVDVMLTIRALEKRGIKTVLLTYEHPGPEGAEMPFLFSVPEADAVVSTGNYAAPLHLPEPERVVGPGDSIRAGPGFPEHLAKAALTLDSRDEYLGGADMWGADSRTVQEY
ncbi:MAG: hypothetical protein HY535_02570 [Chloroflexi bacterium]|nr:hypothetical protein [Chloroflexota bacterium]